MVPAQPVSLAAKFASLALVCAGVLLGHAALAYPTNNITLTFDLAAQNLGSPILMMSPRRPSDGRR